MGKTNLKDFFQKENNGFLKALKNFFERRRSLPSLYQWKHFLRALSEKEKIFFLVLVSIALGCGIFLSSNFYLNNTKIVPAYGGSYTEGVIGQPRFINPIYLSSRDVDRDLVEILFSGLMKYAPDGKIVKDLAKDYKISDDGKTIDVYLKDAYWHDGKPLTADDVLFTIDVIQNQQYQSPLRTSWLGVKVTKLSEKAVRFTLQKKTSDFLERLTLKIIPEHIFENIDPNNLPWVLVSQKYLVGSGPFKFKKIIQDKSGFIEKMVFERNKNYYSKKPFFEEINFVFCRDEEDLFSKINKGEIQGFSLTDCNYIKAVDNNKFHAYFMSLPKYFAAIFNLYENKEKENIFLEKDLRKALAFAVNKEEILKKTCCQKGEIVKSPILPDFFGFKKPSQDYSYNITKAENLLDKIGFKLNQTTKKREKVIEKEPQFLFKDRLEYGDRGKAVQELQKCLAKDSEIYPEGTISGYFGKQTRAAVIRFQEKYANEILTPNGLKKGTGKVGPSTIKKLNDICFKVPKETTPLKFTITTVDKFPATEIAATLKEQWQQIGADVSIRKVNLSDLKTDVLGKRDFQVLILGESLEMIPDPFSFWHSSQKEYPGQDVSGYSSKEADEFLEKARETLNEKEREENLEKFQEILLADMPAIFLAKCDYPYFLSSSIKGFAFKKITQPSKRFSDIENLYSKTKRVWK